MLVYFSEGMTYIGGKGGWKIEKPTTTEMPVHEHKQKEKLDKKKRKLKPLNLKRKKERNSETGEGRGTVRKMPRNRKWSAHATAHLHGDLGKCAILTSRGPVTSFLPITLYKVFITALTGAVD